MPQNERRRVLLLIPHLGGGGAERVTAQLARGLSRDKYDVHLGVVTQGAVPAEPAGEGVAIHALGARRVRAGSRELLWLVRRLAPDAVLSGMAHLNFLVLLLRPLFPRKTRVIVRQDGTASAALESGGLPPYTRLLYRGTYRFADRVVCQTEAMAADLARVAGVAASRLTVLPNPVDVKAIRARALEEIGREARPERTAGGPHLLAVGRLSKEKGFDLLLEALARVRESFPGADLTIAGTGNGEMALRSQCGALGLDGAVHFAGHVDDVTACFAGAPVFALSSRHEGMPNALLEAAAAGLPIVALPSSEGVVDLLRGQPGAWLAPEISAVALAASLQDALAALKPGQRFAHEFVEPFGFDRAIAAYEALIDSVLDEARR